MSKRLDQEIQALLVGDPPEKQDEFDIPAAKEAGPEAGAFAYGLKSVDPNPHRHDVSWCGRR